MSQISWKGPRPLAPGDILKGRDEDLDNLTNKAMSFNILEITAASGVGKSSFIAAGLVPRLRDAGFHIVPDRADWSWSSVLTDYDAHGRASDDPELLYRLCLGWPAQDDDESSLAERLAHVPDGARRHVVVLDQFEELIRYRERLGAALLEFIGRTASQHRVTHVVAARSEYRDRFRPMEDSCGGNFFHWPLPEIEREESVAEIITEPVTAAGLTVEPAATELLRSGWRAARDQPAAELDGSIVGRVDVGLLHLQGVLWLFKRWLERPGQVDPDTSVITADHVLSFAGTYAGREGDAVAPRLFHTALVEYVRVCCDTLHSADTDVVQWMDARASGRVQWNNGPRLMMAKSAHLFSVLGYKVAQSRSGMFQTVLAEDMEPATARQVAASAAASRSKDWLSETASKHGQGIQPRGFAIKWTGQEVLEELLGAATQAWAAASAPGANILRRFVQADEDVYELVHDGMGHALQAWAREELLRPRSVLGVITQRAGESLHLPLQPATFLERSDDDSDDSDADVVAAYWDGFASVDAGGTVSVHGLGWDSSLITSSITDAVIDGWTLTGALFKTFGSPAEIRDVVFRRCDFRGAAIEGAVMTNVRFEHCNLHGASLRECTFDGVEFVQAEPDGTVDESSKIDLFSFVRCEARGQGAALTSLRDTVGLVFDHVTGGPWRVEGTDVRHVAMDAAGRGLAQFRIGPGSYAHLTVEPAGLMVEVDPGATITASELVATDAQGE